MQQIKEEWLFIYGSNRATSLMVNRSRFSWRWCGSWGAARRRAARRPWSCSTTTAPHCRWATASCATMAATNTRPLTATPLQCAIHTMGDIKPLKNPHDLGTTQDTVSNTSGRRTISYFVWFCCWLNTGWCRFVSVYLLQMLN